MNEDRGIGAMPKLYGAPAYARPEVVPVMPVDRPFDPDALPLENELTSEERELVTELQARPYEVSVAADTSPGTGEGSRMLRGRRFRFRLPGRSPDDR